MLPIKWLTYLHDRLWPQVGDDCSAPDAILVVQMLAAVMRIAYFHFHGRRHADVY